jgi:ribonucleotide monophosphatase NagD (HAD superfamily)
MKATLFDLDGVICQGDQACASAADTLAWVQSQGILHRFRTNTTSRPRSDIAEEVR